VWPDVVRHSAHKTAMASIDAADLERMKWYGYFHRKTNDSDHYMCRIRIPACEMTSEQARAIAFIAYRSGYSIVDVTTRGNIQIQGLTIADLPDVRTALERVGLTSRQSGHDNIRNITCHPFSGIDPAELIDTRPLARELQDLIVGNREFSDLPRKFNVAFSGRAEAPGHLWTQDLSFIAVRTAEGQVAFQVLAGGKQGQNPHIAWHLPVLVTPEQVAPFTAALLRAFRELGHRHNRTEVRLRYLIERLGIDGVRREIESRFGAPLPDSPAAPPPARREESPIGWFRQKQAGLWALGICVPVGRLAWDEFEGLALVARDYGGGRVRTTVNQNLIITGIPEAARYSVTHAIARYGLTFEPDTVTKNVVSCTGKQFCNIAVTETKGYAYRLIEELRRRKVQLNDIGLHISGCPSSCANSYTADIGLKGTKIRRRLRVVDAFDVYLGGGVGTGVELGLLYKKAVPFDELASELESVIGEFYRLREVADNFAQYWRRKLAGQKASAVRAALPTWRCSACGYEHVSADPPTYCPVCSAIRIKFEPVAEETDAAPPEGPLPASPAASGGPSQAAAPKAAAKRIVIVGGSIAGHTAAQAVRALDPHASITMLTDEAVSFYNRLNLTRYLAGEVKREQLFDYGAEWYAAQRVDVQTGIRVIGIDALHKTVLTQQGREVPYDACILAHGSAAALPAFANTELRSVHLLRTLADADAILAAARPGTRAVVVGGGVLALEAAYGLATQGATVQVLEVLPRLMPRQLDTASAAWLKEQMAAKRVVSHVGVTVAGLRGAGRVEGLALADGRVIPAELVVISTGIAPNIDWVKRSGIHCGRGIRVDGRMRTSAPGVFAAGDVAEWRGMVMGLWNPAIDQARVAAAGALGLDAQYAVTPPVTILKCPGVSVVSIGEIAEDGGAIASETEQTSGGSYRRLICRKGVPIGAILLGTLSGMGELRQRVEAGWQQQQSEQTAVPDAAIKAAS
jgi:ferredoxin-nitrite reductase